MPEKRNLLAELAKDITRDEETLKGEQLLRYFQDVERQPQAPPPSEFSELIPEEVSPVIAPPDSVGARIISGEIAIPDNGMQITIDPIVGKSQSALLKPDASVWQDDKQIGQYDLTTGEYHDFAVEGMPKWAKVWGAGWGDIATGAAGVMYRFGKQEQGDYLMGVGTKMQSGAPEMEEIEHSDIRMLTESAFWWQQLRSLPFMQAGLIAGGGFGAIAGGAIAGGTTAATGILARFGGKALLGRAAGFGVGEAIPESLMEAGMAYNEARQRGFAKDECNEVWDKVFWGNMKVLPASNMLQFLAFFGGAKVFGGKVTGLLKRMAIGGISQGAEEVLQDIETRKALGDEVVWDKSMAQQAMSGAVMGLMFTTGGSLMDKIANRSIEQMPPDMRTQLEDYKARFIKQGMPEQQAELQALNEIAKTDEGGKLIEKVAKQIAGGLEAGRLAPIPMDKSTWDIMAGQDKLNLVKSLGLDWTVAGKSFEALTETERASLTVTPEIAPEAVRPPTEAVKREVGVKLPEAATTKLPYQMTKAEFVADRKRRLEDVLMVDPKKRISSEVLHRRSVKDALDSGWAVSPEVLKDYPDLALPTPSPVTPEVAPVEAPAVAPVPKTLTAQVKEMYSGIQDEIRAAKAGLKGLKGQEAQAARQSIKLMERELSSIDKLLSGVDVVAKDVKTLRQKIMAVSAYKGLPATQRRALFKKTTGVANLTSMTEAQLSEVLEVVQKARPKTIKGKHVLKESTERGIQSLRKELIKNGKLNEATYKRILKDNKLLTDKYQSSDWFITEREGRELIRAINREAEVGLIEYDNIISGVMKDNPTIAKAIEGIKSRIEKAKPPEGVGVSPFFDMPIYVQKLQERTSSRIYDVYEKALRLANETDRRVDLMDKALEKVTPEFRDIARDEKALERITQYIASKHKMGPEAPANITEAEIKIADQISKDLFSYQNDVRYYRFYNAYYKYNANADLISEEIHAPVEDIREAIKIYESKGATALGKYLKTKKWGVIESGYEPHIAVNPKLQLHKVRAAIVGKGHLKSREGINFGPQEKNILQRRKAYIKQMENLKLEPYFREMGRMFQADVAPKLKDPHKVGYNLDLAITEMKGYYPQEWFAKLAMRMAGFTFSNLALSPHMFVRNLFQNPALHPDVAKILDPRNDLLSEQDLEYMETYVQNYKAVMREWLMQEGMGNTRVERFIRKISYYGKSDQINRIIAFHISLNKAKMAIARFKRDGNVQKLINTSGMLDMSRTEQVKILETLARDRVSYGVPSLKDVTGKEAAARDIAEFVTTRTHLRYRRRARAPVEMGISGRILGNLMTFPRGVNQMMYLRAEKIKPSYKATTAEKRSATRMLLQAAVMMYLSGSLYCMLTGKRRNPYDLLSMLLSWGPGGLAIGSIQAITDIFNDINGIIHGEEWGMKNLVKDLPRAGDMFIPLYGITLNTLEAVVDEKYLDRKKLREIVAIFDANYTVNDDFYKQERNWYQKLQHAIFGGEVPDLKLIEVAVKGVDEAVGMIGKEDTAKKEKALAGVEGAEKRVEIEGKDWTYTTSDLGSAIRSATYGLEPDMRNTDNGLPEIVEYYWAFKEQRDYYYDDLTSSQQKEYKDGHPEFVADMVFWGTWSTIYDGDTEARVKGLAREYGIPQNAIPALGKKQEEIMPPPPTSTPSPPTSQSLDDYAESLFR